MLQRILQLPPALLVEIKKSPRCIQYWIYWHNSVPYLIDKHQITVQEEKYEQLYLIDEYMRLEL